MATKPTIKTLTAENRSLQNANRILRELLDRERAQNNERLRQVLDHLEVVREIAIAKRLKHAEISASDMVAASRVANRAKKRRKGA